MHIVVPESQDVEALRAIAADCGATVNFPAELARSYGRVWAARAARGAPLCAFLVAWVAGEELEIIDLCTAPRSRRRGAGRALVQQATECAKALGLQALSLEVRQSNRAAQALYAKAGFKMVGERPAYYSDTGEDAWILRLDLNATSEPAAATDPER